MTINHGDPLRGVVTFRRTPAGGALGFMGATITARAQAEGWIVAIMDCRAAAISTKELRLRRWCGGVVVLCLVHLRHALGLGLFPWWLQLGTELQDEKPAAHLEGTLTRFSVYVSLWFPASFTRNNRQGRRDVPTGAARPGSYIAVFSACLAVVSCSAVDFGTMAK